MSGSNEEEDAELDERGMHLGDVFADDEATDEDAAERRAASQPSATGEPSATSATSETETTTETTATSDTEAAGDPAGTDTGGVAGNPGDGAGGQASKIVRESKNLNIYVPEDLYERVQRTYKELDGEYYATHGEDLEKNREFYTALLRAGLESDELRERIGIE